MKIFDFLPSDVTSVGNYALGYKTTSTKLDGFTITGVGGSALETYANANGIKFVDPSAMLADPDGELYMNKADKTMPNIEVETAVSKLKAITAVTVTDTDGNTVSDYDYIGTGYRVTDSDGNVYTVIVSGDVDGNGMINSSDYLKIKLFLTAQATLDGAYFNAADTDKNGDINITDYLRIKAYFFGNFNLY